MNIQSEIDFFSDLNLIDKARFVVRLSFEIADAVKGGAGDERDVTRLKFANEMHQRLARFAYQLLSEDPARPQDDVMLRMLLGTRTDKKAEELMHTTYRRVLLSFESFDTTVLLNPQ